MDKVKRNRSGKWVIAGLIAIVLCLLLGRNFLVSHDPNITIQPPSYFPAKVDTGIISVKGASLGRLLFNDPILSLGHKISCASCHQQAAAYADYNKVFSTGDNYQLTKRNSPALLNLVFKESFFADGRAYRLEQTVLNAIHDSLELHSSLPLILSRLNAHEGYKDKFKAFTGKEQVEESDFVEAIVQYLRTLNSWNSKYDAVMQQREQFSPAEEQGWLLFQANCQSCHSTALFSNKSRYAVNTGESQEAFVVPTLRNIEFSAPYFHNGSAKTLEKALVFHADKTNTKELPRSLTVQEQQAVITFLKTLSDRQFVSSNSY